MKLKGRIALVTGGSRGIGAEIVKEFHEEGAFVYLNYNKSESKAKEMENEFDRIRSVKGDVSNRNDLKDIVKIIEDEKGGLDILVNNAGIMVNIPLLEYKDDIVRRMFEVNMYGTIYSTLESVRIMRPGSAIINIASNAGIGTSFMNTTYYSMTKAAVINFTKRAALELSDKKIRVNGIAPGWIETDLTIGARTEKETSLLKRFLEENTTIGRWGYVQDVARVAVFLASDDSQYINGQIIVVDGGRKDYLTHSI